MGPQATASLFQRLMDFTLGERDQDYPTVAVLNCTQVPDRTEFLLGRSDCNPLEALLSGVADLNRLGVGRILIPCNTSHAFFEQLQQASPAPLVNMAGAALAYLFHRRGPKQPVCILATLGTVQLGIYHRFNRHGLTLVEPPADLCREVHSLIYQVKAAGAEELPSLVGQLEAIMARVQAQLGQVTFLLACTELSLLKPLAPGFDVVDALDVAALVALAAAGKPLRLPADMKPEALHLAAADPA